MISLKAVILAGGRGTRLKPYTHVLPKPLMPVGTFPVLEIILRQFAMNGFRDVILSTGYLSEIIKSFCGTGERFGVKILYSREDKLLGTAGPLGSLKDELKQTFLVTNGDILTAINFSDFIKQHKEQGALLTMGLKKRRYNIQFGVVKLDNNQNVLDYIEKPTQEHMVSIGMYLMEPAILDYIKPKTYLDLPDLIKQLINHGEKVQGFVVDNLWLHLSRADDFENANANLGNILSELKLDGVLNNLQ